MENNPILNTMMNRRSIRKYTDEMPSDEVIETVVRAGQQAPFASQLTSVLLSRNARKNFFHAPLLFTLCLDMHKMELVMKKRGWDTKAPDTHILLMGCQDVSLFAENMTLAGESLGLGSCLLGFAPYMAGKIAEQYHLPQRVFPIVQLSMGYPDETPPPRPRYPLSFTLFEDKYPELSEEEINEAMNVMDEGYLAQDYYRQLDAKIPLTSGDEDTFTFDDYSWTEHISRKWGQMRLFENRLKETLAVCGFSMEE
ncbi:MAG: nitroreductase family protein [Anaerolineales bacterium]|nr:nitroreductase family protein [Anaerolineales bacterium]